jgi:tetratricopeptide (TPR) repeat protein
MLLMKVCNKPTLLVLLALLFAPAAIADEAAWNKYTTEGARAYESGNFGVAQKNFEMSLAEAKKFGANDMRLATSLTNLGVLYSFRNQNAKAGPLFEQAVRIKQKALGPDNYETIAAVAKLCQFNLKNSPAKAEPICNRVVGYVDQRLKEKREVALSFETLNKFYKRHKELEEAEVFVKQAENQTGKATTSSYLELAVLVDGLAGACKDVKKFQPAEQLYKRALALRHGVLPKDHMALASSLENLGKLYCEEGRYHMAEPLYRRAMEISKTTLGAQKPETFAKIDGLGQCLVNLSKLSEAKSLYQEAHSSFESAYGKGSKYVMDCDIQLGHICIKQGNNGQAAQYYGDAVKISEKINGPRHASLSALLDCYGGALAKANRQGEAKRMFSRAREIRG